MKTLLVLAAAVLIFVPAAFGTSVVAPNNLCGSGSASCATNEGGSSEATYPFGPNPNDWGRQQSIFTATDMGGQPFTINSIGFRPDTSVANGTYNWDLPIQVRLAYVGSSTFSGTTFYESGTVISGTWKNVFDGSWAGSMTTTGGTTNLEPFSMVITLSTPFVYDGASNLLVDLLRDGHAPTSDVFTWAFDEAGAGNSRELEGVLFKGIPTTGRQVNELMVMQFSGTEAGGGPAGDTPEPATLAMMGGGLLALGLFRRRRGRA